MQPRLVSGERVHLLCFDLSLTWFEGFNNSVCHRLGSQMEVAQVGGWWRSANCGSPLHQYSLANCESDLTFRLGKGKKKIMSETRLLVY